MNKQELERNPRKALGKGLSALLPGKNGPAAKPEPAATSTAVAEPTPTPPPRLPDRFEQFQNVPCNMLVINEQQPRTNFASESLQELAQSIRVHGVLQPITVKRLDGGKYMIIAGERRWQAARIAGLTEIPALVRTVEQNQLLELALIENIQREDLNPIETAVAFARLINEHHLSHEQVAERTGKERSTVTNFLRLLKLANEVQEDLVRGDITMGHARAILSLPTHQEQRQVTQRVIDQRLSVRETERLVKDLLAPKPQKPAPEKLNSPALDANARAAVESMQSALGTKVRLVPKSASSGRIEIEYYSQDDLDRVYSAIIRGS